MLTFVNLVLYEKIVVVQLIEIRCGPLDKSVTDLKHYESLNSRLAEKFINSLRLL